ncbi:MAG TPA: hypothetical protein VIQ80_03435 [Candidatus Saccharimonadales bacterium]
MPRVPGYIKVDGHQSRRSGNWFLLSFGVDGGGQFVVAVPQDLNRNVRPVVFRRSGTVTNMQVVHRITGMIDALR